MGMDFRSGHMPSALVPTTIVGEPAPDQFIVRLQLIQPGVFQSLPWRGADHHFGKYGQTGQEPRLVFRDEGVEVDMAKSSPIHRRCTLSAPCIWKAYPSSWMA